MAGKLSGSAIQSGTITVTQLSGSFNDTTNAAYAQANSAYGQANAARSDANTTFATVNSTFGTINTNYQAAYAAANNSNLKAGGLVSGTLNVTQDIIIGGNVYLEGNTTFINVATYSVEDSLIYMSSNNKLTDSVDIGIMGGKNTSGTYSHTGLARDATDAKWKLFDGLAEEGHVGNVVDFANTYLATLVANVEANTLTVVNGVSGNVNFDSGTLFVDSVGNEVGIGTTNPATTLHVDASGGGIVRVSRLGTGSGILQMEADGTDGAISSTNNTRFQTNSTERMRIATGGNVGIGTTNPAQKLHVDGNLQVSGNSSPTGSGITMGTISGSYRWIQSFESQPLYINPLGNNVIFNRDGGNVGIGTTSPTNKLEVDGGSSAVALRISTTNAGSDVASLILSNSSKSAFNDGIKISHGGGYTTFKDLSSNTIMAFDVTNTRVGIGTGSPGVPFHVVAPNGGAIINSSTGTNRVWLRVNNTGGDFYFGREDSSGGFFGTSAAYASVLWSQGAYPLILASNGTERMRITSTGNFGIGTNSPSYKLHIQEGGITAAAISTGWPSYGAESATQSKYVLYLDAGGNGGTTTAGQGASATLLIGNYYDSRGIITMIGAGGGSPSDVATGYGKDLMVKGGNSDNTNGYVGGRLFLAGGSGYSGGAFGSNYGAVVLQPQGGNVGIGTTNPGTCLHIYRSGNPPTPQSLYATLLLETDSTSNYQRIRYDVGGTPYWGLDREPTTNDFLITGRIGSTWTDGVIRVKQSNGNVGIGTTNPTKRLSVNGEISANATLDLSGDGGAGYVASRVILRTHDNYRGTGIFMVGETSAASNNTFFIGTPYSDHSYGVLIRYTANNYTTDYQSSAYTAAGRTLMWLAPSGAVSIPGSLSKGSGSFKIDHPLLEKSNTHHLVHSFIEGPQADLIYRGKVELVDGSAIVNIDTASGMTEGTFIVLCREVQCFTTNETSWDAVRGSVSENILTIECQNTSSDATISWMVIGERQDKHMYETEWTDENGKVIVEPEKEIITNQE